jgi:hypothetical protein
MPEMKGVIGGKLKNIEPTYPHYFNGVLSEVRAKELGNTAKKKNPNTGIKLDDDVRRLISGNPYTKFK